jgi:hypothetical protein
MEPIQARQSQYSPLHTFMDNGGKSGCFQDPNELVFSGQEIFANMSLTGNKMKPRNFSLVSNKDTLNKTNANFKRSAN